MVQPGSRTSSSARCRASPPCPRTTASIGSSVAVAGALGRQDRYLGALRGAARQPALPTHRARHPGTLDPRLDVLVLGALQLQPEDLSEPARRFDEAISRNDSLYREHGAPIWADGFS